MLIIGFYINHNILQQKTDTMKEHLDRLKQSIITEDTSSIDALYHNTIKYWDKHKKYMFIFSHHHDVDNISSSLIKIRERILSQNYASAIEEIELSKEILSALPLNETARLVNVF